MEIAVIIGAGLAGFAGLAWDYMTMVRQDRTDSE